MLDLQAALFGGETVRRPAPLITRCCAAATALALPLMLNASAVPLPAPAAAASASQPPSPETTPAEISTSDDELLTVEVSSPKGTRTWSASSLTDNGLPGAAHRAYVRGAQAMSATDPACQVPWTLLAGIGRVESDHGRYGGSVLGKDGVSHPFIIGVALNGDGPVAAIPDTDDGRFDKDTVWDRAVGPMQFIPSTWTAVTRDGDGDGVKSPNDIDDAALAAAAYLCSGSGSVLGESAMRAAIFRYNASKEYVALVMAMERGYRTGVFILPFSGTDHQPTRHGQPGGGPAHDGDGGAHDSAGSSSPSGGTAPNTNPQGGSPTSGGGGGGGNDGAGNDGAGGEGGTPPGPSPPPSPQPDPTTEEKSGTLAPCGTGWCLDGWALDLGGDAKLGQPAGYDYDGDSGSDETNQQELEGLSGSSVTVVVNFGTATVIKVQGLPYA